MCRYSLSAPCGALSGGRPHSFILHSQTAWWAKPHPNSQLFLRQPWLLGVTSVMSVERYFLSPRVPSPPSNTCSNQGAGRLPWDSELPSGPDLCIFPEACLYSTTSWKSFKMRSLKLITQIHSQILIGKRAGKLHFERFLSLEQRVCPNKM